MSSLRKPVTAVLFVASSVLLAACSDSNATGSDTDTAAQAASAAPARIELDVYKSPTCGCCGSWIEHAEEYGFDSSVHHPDDLNGVKDDYGIGQRFRSCHTAVSADGYVFEGHVPARLVQKFLAQPPAGALGLAVPGMPMGSPGMEMGDRFSPYPVVLLHKDGSFELYEEIRDQQAQY